MSTHLDDGQPYEQPHEQPYGQAGGQPYAQPQRAAEDLGPDRAPEPAGDVAGREERALHDAAARSLRRKREFWGHARAYLIVNAMIVTVWLATCLANRTWYFFWPVFPLAGWGVGLAFHASGTFGRSAQPVSEPAIRAEMDRLRRS